MNDNAFRCVMLVQLAAWAEVNHSKKGTAMARAKEAKLRQDELHQSAINLLVKTQAVYRCEAHEEIYLKNMDESSLDHAYALGTLWVRDGKVNGEREEFLATVKSAYGDAGYECPTCEKHRYE